MQVISLMQQITPQITGWLLQHGVRIALILIGAYIILRFSGAVIERIIRKAVRPDHFSSRNDEKKREDTLIHIARGALRVFVWVVAAMMVLSEAGVNIGPLVAAAGIAGLAFGFGGQYLIRDVVSGLFMVLENQYRVNDVVCLDETCGLVEDISIRMTTLRDLDGAVHHVPHGEIKRVSNLSKLYARVNLNIGVSYAADLEKVIAVVNRVGKALADDPQWKDAVITPPQFLRVDDFGDSAVIIKILGDTQPLKQWDVTGELRKRLKVAFDKEKIEIPFPQRVIYQRKG